MLSRRLRRTVPGASFLTVCVACATAFPARHRGRVDSQRLRGGGVFLDLHIHVDRSFPALMRTSSQPMPIGRMDFRGCHHPHIAVDTRPRVPARVGVAAVVHPYGKHIVAFLQVGRQVVEERDVAVRRLPSRWPLRYTSLRL